MEQFEPTTPANDTDQDVDQDAEPTMTAPPEDRPDAGASALHHDAEADDADAADADGRG